MKKLHQIFIMVFVFNSSLFSQDLKDKYQSTVLEFVECIRLNDTSKLVTLISFPLKRQYPLPAINDESDFFNRYSEVFDDSLKRMISNSDITKNWSDVGWRGIMLNNGTLWLDYDGKLRSVNYQSKVEAKNRKNLIETAKKSLHESIKQFDQPEVILETEKFRIRIDQMKEGDYRYASWSITAEMSEKPDLVLRSGEIEFDGSGGNHSYKFKNHTYLYECSITVIGSPESPDAVLSVYKNDELILQQAAKIIR